MNPEQTPLGPLTQSTTVHCPQQTQKKSARAFNHPHGLVSLQDDAHPTIHQNADGAAITD
jgi:hypothetical protein